MTSARPHLAAAVSGLVFGLGLVVSEMAKPRKIIGFLDVFGNWDPTLVFVMAGAVAVHAVAYRLWAKRETPLLAPHFHLPTRKDIDVRLVAGAAVFGVGWGLAGYCPGPSLVALPAMLPSGVVFVAALVAGTFATIRLKSRQGDLDASPRTLNRTAQDRSAGPPPLLT